ncbi:MAG TPA: S-layer homology domain-containing protein [Bryobacteraceae bacterium]|nr:S-layer homology domain-containing protein [Bryobacteraceae bacterium]
MLKRRHLPWLLCAALLTLPHTQTGRILAQSAICGPFSDVPSSSTFCPFILEAYLSNITQGTSATTFNPVDPVNREQAVTFLSRTMDQTLHRATSRTAIGKSWSATATGGGIAADVGTAASAGASINDIVSDGTFLWVARSDSKIIKVNAADRHQIETWTIPSGSPRKLGVFAGMVWIADNAGNLYSFNPANTPGSAGVSLGNGGVTPGSPALAFDGSNVWWASAGGTKIALFPLPTPLPTSFSPGTGTVEGMVFDGTNMWVLLSDSHLLKLSIPAPGGIPVVQETLTLPGVVNDCRMLYDGSNIWIPIGTTGTLYVVRPSLSSAGPSSIVKNEPIPDVVFPYVASFDSENVMIGGLSNGTVALYRSTTLSRIRTFGSGAAGVRGIASDGLTFNVGDTGSTRFFQF